MRALIINDNPANLALFFNMPVRDVYSGGAKALLIYAVRPPHTLEESAFSMDELNFTQVVDTMKRNTGIMGEIAGVSLPPRHPQERHAARRSPPAGTRNAVSALGPGDVYPVRF